MKSFIFKSNESDLQKMLQSIETIQKNVLYLTYRMDTVLKTTHQLLVDKNLKLQVEEYHDETSHQTELETPLDED